jgi:thiamine-phosphate pyrophosphorylase
MDGADGAGDEAGMKAETPAETLWRLAVLLNRAAARVDAAVAHLPPLLFLTDPERTPRPWTAAARLPAGAGVVHRGFGRPEAHETALRLREATSAAGVRLLIALDADLAEAVGADGVHLPERALHLAPALRLRAPDWLITGAAHPPALPDGLGPLDAVLASPVFAAGEGSAARPRLGVAGLEQAIPRLGRPTYALGGVDAGSANRLAGCGACGIAAVGAVFDAFGA